MLLNLLRFVVTQLAHVPRVLICPHIAASLIHALVLGLSRLRYPL